MPSQLLAIYWIVSTGEQISEKLKSFQILNKIPVSKDNNKVWFGLFPLVNKLVKMLNNFLIFFLFNYSGTSQVGVLKQLHLRGRRNAHNCPTIWEEVRKGSKFA
jgi:hypothetical protein